MSFLIQITPEYSNIIDYERILIYAVAEMNKTFAIKNNFFDFCLNCQNIQYKDMQGQFDFLEIDHISNILDKGWAKCDSLVAWFIALKQLEGYETEPIIQPLGNLRFHVKMKYRKPMNHWKYIDPTDVIKKGCSSCSLDQ